MFVLRQSEYIEEEKKRNWSSFNFGQDGFEGTEEELEEHLEWVDSEDNNSTMISCLEIFNSDECEFGELYDNYWVVKDGWGLSAAELEAETLDEAIEYVKREKEADCYGDGVKFDANKAKHVWSNEDNDLHIFEIEDTI